MASFKSLYERPLKTIDSLGEELAFFARAIAWTPRAIGRYKKEIMRLLAEVISAKGFERHSYFEGAKNIIDGLPKLEGTVHVNRALTLKFLPNYLFGNEALDAPPARGDAGEGAVRQVRRVDQGRGQEAHAGTSASSRSASSGGCATTSPRRPVASRCASSCRTSGMR